MALPNLFPKTISQIAGRKRPQKLDMIKILSTETTPPSPEALQAARRILEVQADRKQEGWGQTPADFERLIARHLDAFAKRQSGAS